LTHLHEATGNCPAVWFHWQAKVLTDHHCIAFPHDERLDNDGFNLTSPMLLLHGWFWLIEILLVKCLNNMIEQDHRFIKTLTRPMKGFRSFPSASATLDGIEVAHMLRKHQFSTSGQSAFQQFAA
jgi:putative transposase